ncbi:Uncharacterised protein (plasmid) [Mycoplasmopsis pulmonis]|nr:Uncharacterised protein [Mycoplasmopsis pulmonis]
MNNYFETFRSKWQSAFEKANALGKAKNPKSSKGKEKNNG